MIKYFLYISLLVVGCGQLKEESPQYRCMDVDPGVIWANAYAAHYVDPKGNGAKQAVRLANQAVADWESACKFLFKRAP